MILCDCIFDSELLLKYIDSLKWIGLILFFFIYYKQLIDSFINRIVSDSDEVSFSFFSAKFKKDIEEAKTKSKTFDQLTQNIEKVFETNLVDQIKLKSTVFMSKGVADRKKAADEIYTLAHQIPISRIIELSRSILPGEKISALIGIKAHIDIYKKDLGDRKDIDDFVKECLFESNSRIRYRALQVFEVSQIMSKKYFKDIKALYSVEDNPACKRLMLSLIQSNS